MLSHLSIKNYALIDEIDISFSSGLSIITGETGAGKSIILGALSLLLGQRSEGKYFFNQQKKCVIEGHFSIKDYHLQDFFELQDIDYEEHTILRREIHHEGKSRAFINDTPVTLTTLKALGERLIAIHSQHAVLEINTESFQFLALDALAGNADLQQEFSKEFRNFKRIQAQLETALEEEKRLALEADYHQFLFEELEQAELNDPNEEEKLQEELKVLSNAEEIKSNLQGMYQLMMGHEGSLVEQVQQAANHLDQVASFSLPLQDLHARLKSSFLELKDIAEEIGNLQERTELNEEELLTVQDRLSTLFKLQQKHQVNSIEALQSIQQELAEKLAAVTSNQELLDHLAKLKQESERKARGLAEQLSKKRRAAAAPLETQLEALLTQAGMPNARFQVELKGDKSSPLKNNGQDSILFKFSANKGQEPQPLSKVASGGELSRLMLAIKSILAKHTALPTLIFDEIDTGISGEIAMKVAGIMEELGENLQVIAISHLPQIAARGKAHFKVFKASEGGETKTQIAALDAQQRVLEIAQMLGGMEPSETAIQHAKELLS